MLELLLFLAVAQALFISPRKGESVKLGHETASFGKQQPYDVRGLIVRPFDEFLCSETGNYSHFKDNIALATRGNCSFFQKAWLAAEAGAKALIIGNNASTRIERKMIRLDDFKKDAPDVQIPVVWISGKDYEFIVEQMKNYTIQAFLNGEGDVAVKKPMFHLIPPLVLILVWMTIIGMYFCRKLVMRYISRQHRMSAMNATPTIPYRPVEEESEEDAMILNSRCVICMEDFVEGEELKALPCRHGFHASCIDPWLAEHSERCPICNQSLLQYNPGREYEMEVKSPQEGRT
uniref:RING-type domain-containing protein n=1 Tax=Lotharella globosa TaxID=91324 RepID=A0A7S4DYU4_9EUKA|mmetsp:Transcript_5795/g.11486  ORF Transcript_5795/g.11486 Transcript_5795/m.11486 type:complete len:291 (+) Transcript_5795:31-903(+)